jgi:glucose-1-phosphate adenylyltransferase
MAINSALGIIFPNSYDEVVPDLTALRAMGSVPYAGRYRLIDLPLSAMVNAGITQVGVITNTNYRSLMDHLGNGKPWDLSRKNEGLTILPPFSNPDVGMSINKLAALYGSIEYITRSNKDYVVLTDCNVVCGIDLEDMIKFCSRKNADIAFATANGLPANIKNATEIIYDDTGKISELKRLDYFSKAVDYSMKICVIRRVLLERLLHEANAKRIATFEDLFITNMTNLNMYAYKYEGYCKVIASTASYYEACMDLLNPEIRKSLFCPDRPVYTKTGDRAPAIYGISASVKNSLIADGCKIEGEVENCIIFRGVHIGKGAKVKNSIIMQDSVIDNNTEVECVITDKNVTIRPSKKLCGASNYPVYIGKGIVI